VAATGTAAVIVILHNKTKGILSFGFVKLFGCFVKMNEIPPVVAF